MEPRYDDIYPLGPSDPNRVCRECGGRYPQWSRLQDREAFSMCLRCAPVFGERKRRQRKFAAR